MKKLYDEVGTFAITTFGKASNIDHLKKLKKEAEETIENPNSSSEYADCLICVFAAAFKTGMTYDALVKAVILKMKLNKTRGWELQNDGTFQHI